MGCGRRCEACDATRPGTTYEMVQEPQCHRGSRISGYSTRSSRNTKSHGQQHRRTSSAARTVDPRRRQQLHEYNSTFSREESSAEDAGVGVALSNFTMEGLRSIQAGVGSLVNHFFEEEDDDPLLNQRSSTRIVERRASRRTCTPPPLPPRSAEDFVSAIEDGARPLLTSGSRPADSARASHQTSSSDSDSGDDMWDALWSLSDGAVVAQLSSDEDGEGLLSVQDGPHGQGLFSMEDGAETLDAEVLSMMGMFSDEDILMNMHAWGGGEEAIVAEVMRRSMEEEAPRSQTPPVDEAMIQALPVRKLSYAQVRSMPENCKGCAICLEDFQAREFQRTLPCLHSFHKDCIDECLRRSNTCPICRHCVSSSGDDATDVNCLQVPVA